MDIPSAEYPVDQVIDITSSSSISVYELRAKLDVLQKKEANDAGLPVISHGALRGLLPTMALESLLMKMEEMTNSTCLLSTQSYGYSEEGTTSHGHERDLTYYIDKVRLYPSV